MKPWNLSSLLLDQHLEAGNGERVAIRFAGRSITYAGLAAMTAGAAGVLHDAGVRPGDRVAMLLEDRPEFIATFLGAVRIGAVAVPLNTLQPLGEAAALVRHCGAAAVIAETSLRDALRPILPAAVTSLDASAIATPGASPDPIDPADTTRDSPCFWQYSSGTTGTPKAVMHRHGDYEAITDLYGAAVLGMTAGDRSFSVSKLFFSYGLGNSLAFPLRHGASVVLHPDRPQPRAIFDLIRSERPTIFYAVPTQYAALLAAADAEPAAPDLSSVRRCISAGEALPAALFERWRERFGLEILDGIGSTEVGYIFISNAPGAVRPGASGRLVPGYDAKVIAERGDPVTPGEIGDLWVRGPSTFTGYHGDAARTAETIQDGWVATGDKYAVDADGYYRWAGRSDDVFKVAGMWVAPAVVEGAIASHPAVLECAVVGRADESGLIKPAAFVTLRAGASANEDEIGSFVAGRIASFMRPRWIRFLPELPKTATGKIQRYRLRSTPGPDPP